MRSRRREDAWPGVGMRPMLTAVGDPSVADAALMARSHPVLHWYRGNTPRSIFTAPLPAPGLSDDALGQALQARAARRELATSAQGARRAMKLEPCDLRRLC